MDELSALDWPGQAKDTSKTQAYSVPLPAFAALRPTPPTSGRSSPLPKASSNPPLKKQSAANDSFSNLVSFSSASTNKTLSLEEQQKRLLEQKAQQRAARQKQFELHYSGGDEGFWNNLGSGRSTPAPLSVVSATAFPNSTRESHRNGTTGASFSQASTEDEGDILAAFNADAPVDSSSYFPKPSESSIAADDAELYIGSTVPVERGAGRASSSVQNLWALEDDDAFGLAELPKKHFDRSREVADHQNDEEDILGLLGKPVSDLPRPRTTADTSLLNTEQTGAYPQDQAIAELMEMGFSTERAREALESTESGTDVQRAVAWLLNKAHSESRQKAGPRRTSNEGPRQSRDPRIDRKSGARPNRQLGVSEQAISNDGRLERSRRQHSPSSSDHLEKIPAQMASEIGTAFLKTAGSLWKTSTKKVQQAVQEFNSDSDSSQPKWMRGSGAPRNGQVPEQTHVHDATTRPRRRNSTKKQSESVTDEAILLESDRARPQPRKPLRRQEPSLDSSADNSRDHSPAIQSRFRQELPAKPAFFGPQPSTTQPRLEPKAVLNRQVIDDQASQAYVSSSRRRKPASTPPPSASELDLLESVAQPHPPKSTPGLGSDQSFQSVRLSKSPLPIHSRPAASSRDIAPISSISLKASHAAREAGNDQFKRGDYAAAHQSYTSSLKHLPANHPITIVLLTNRALTALKIGEPRIAISDSEAAIVVIGPGRGEGEIIDLSNGEPPKPMRDYFGKATMRKAEALEQKEQWKEAAIVWKEAVEGGHGAATSIEGRLRCVKMARPQQAERSKPPLLKKASTPIPARSAVSDPNGTANGLSSAAAVNRLRAADAAADRADDERFALTDTVDAKLVAWKAGKADNLRALLGSLDTVLWPEAGWKKIGMAELVLPTKVKVQYLKGIAKVHPDKVCRSITSHFCSTHGTWI
jgi:UBA/TS-N domain